MGSGRRSRSLNPMLGQELSNRERNTSESNNKSNVNLSNTESDDESHNEKHSFNRFSPLRKTFSV